MIHSVAWRVAHLPYAVCMDVRGVQCVRKHGVERHLPYFVCIEDLDEQCVIEHGVKRHMSYVVCVKKAVCGARYSNRTWCRPSPAI